MPATARDSPLGGGDVGKFGSRLPLAAQETDRPSLVSSLWQTAESMGHSRAWHGMGMNMAESAGREGFPSGGAVVEAKPSEA